MSGRAFGSALIYGEGKMTHTIKQLGLFGEPAEVVSKSAAWASRVTLDALEAAINEAVCNGREPEAEPVRTQSGALTTVVDSDLGAHRKQDVIKSLTDRAREQQRVEKALAAGEDPYADDYWLELHEASDAIFDCLRLGEDPDELEFTAYHPTLAQPTRTIKLSECNFIGAPEKTYGALVTEMVNELQQFEAYMAEHSDIMEEDLM